MIILFKPQVQLFKRVTSEGDTEYILYAITHFNKSNYQSTGNHPFSFVLDENGLFNISLTVVADENLECLNVFKTVTHTVNLGVVPFTGTNSKIQVSVFEGEALVGKTIVDEIDAEEDGKPGNEAIQSMAFGQYSNP